MVIVRTGKFNNEAKEQKGRSAQAAFLAENAVKTLTIKAIEEIIIKIHYNSVILNHSKQFLEWF